MSDYFNCDVCDMSDEIKSKTKYLNSQLHKGLIKQVINRYRVENPDFIQRKYNKKLCF